MKNKERQLLFKTTFELVEGLNRSTNKPDKISVRIEDPQTDVVTVHRAGEEIQTIITERPEAPKS